MARQGGKILPNKQEFDLGDGVGYVEVTPTQVIISPGFADCLDREQKMILDPSSAPLFRMIANRLDEITGKRRAR